MATLIKPIVVSYRLHGKKVPKGTRGATRAKKRAKKWYGQGIPGLPPRKRVPLAADKTVAQRMLADLVAAGERGGAGMADLAHAKRPIDEHLAAFEAHLKTEGTPANQIRLRVYRIRQMAAACEVKVAGDITAAKVQAFLEGLRADRAVPPLDPARAEFAPAEAAALLGVSAQAVRHLVAQYGLAAAGEGRARRYPRATVEALLARAARGASAQTSNFYLQSLRSFCLWLADTDRVPKNPLPRTTLRAENVTLDRRHDRRDLSAAELTRLLEVTAASPAVFRGLAGTDRYAIYLAACGTGFRAHELATLTPELLDLDAAPPVARLPARRDKARRVVVQPLPLAVAAVLREYGRGRPAGKPLWPGTWFEDGAKMLRLDLAAADIPYQVAGPDGPLFADFHALRHTYISRVVAGGATVKESQTLARHSTPTLTFGRYAHADRAGLAAAAERAAPGAPAVDRQAAVEALAGLALALWAAFVGAGASGGANPPHGKTDVKS